MSSNLTASARSFLDVPVRAALALIATMNQSALDALRRTVARLEGLLQQAQDQPDSTFWQEMQKQRDAARTQVNDLRSTDRGGPAYGPDSEQPRSSPASLP